MNQANTASNANTMASSAATARGCTSSVVAMDDHAYASVNTYRLDDHPSAEGTAILTPDGGVMDLQGQAGMERVIAELNEKDELIRHLQDQVNVGRQAAPTACAQRHSCALCSG